MQLKNNMGSILNRVVGIMVVYSTGMLVIWGSKHCNSIKFPINYRYHKISFLFFFLVSYLRATLG